MARPKFVQIPLHRLERFKPLLGDDYERVEAAAEAARELLEGRVVWNISSTLRGGGVAEMLRSLLPYVRGAGIDARWVVLRERPEFFELTKRLHNNLHEDRGDGGPLGAEQLSLYERTLAESARHLTQLFQDGDIVFLHDPQTAGLVPAAKAAGALVVWRCHIGADRPGAIARRARDFLSPYVSEADAFVFSRGAYSWETLAADRIWEMPPCIDPFSPKNRDLDDATVEAIVDVIGLGDEPRVPYAPIFLRADGTPARVERRAEVIQETPLPKGSAVVAQVSRWDRLKDHRGLLECFHRHLAAERVHLVLAGPASAAVADDPEGAEVWRSVGRAWRDLPADARGLVHLVSLPMDDIDENAAMVNALQRRADVVVQKSLAEGFGLTVAEAMWKRRPVVGTRVGGIQDQIVDGESGLLVDEPRDLAALARAVLSLLADEERSAEIGEHARQRVAERYLVPVRLAEYAEMIGRLSAARAG